MSSSGRGSPIPASPPSIDLLGRRAQLLATEHWGLLAARSTTWSEVMSRISIHLTVTSASLVVLALVVQASGFGTAFRVLSIGLTSVILILGTLTGIRVLNASQDDSAMVVGMNRLRAAYVEMDPALTNYFVESWHDDQSGVMQTYLMGRKRHLLLHILGSTSMFMNIINTLVAGTLGALIAWTGGAPVVLIAILGTAAGLAYFAGAMAISRRAFAGGPDDVRFPTPPDG